MSNEKNKEEKLNAEVEGTGVKVDAKDVTETKETEETETEEKKDKKGKKKERKQFKIPGWLKVGANILAGATMLGGGFVGGYALGRSHRDPISSVPESTPEIPTQTQQQYISQNPDVSQPGFTTTETANIPTMGTFD